MAAECKVVVVDPDSELGRALDDAGSVPVVLLCGEVRFLVVPDKVPTLADPNDIWANYDPDGIRQGLREIAGIITLEEAERRTALVSQWREDGTRPIDRPRLPGVDDPNE